MLKQDLAIQSPPGARNQGVSLMETSMVLVIIGLIVGSIFIGQTLIKNAEIRGAITQYQTFTQSAKQFQDKYTALPGDLYNANSLWSGATDGNGNGRVEGAEEFLAWQHLAKAKMIEGSFTGVTGDRGPHDRIPGVNVPLAPIKNVGWGFVYVDVSAADNSVGWWWSHRIYYHRNNIPPDHAFWTGGRLNGDDNEMNVYLTTREAYDIDKKLDDGYPGTGKVLVQYNAQSTGMHCKDVAAFGTTTRYDFNYTSEIVCALIFKSGF